MRTDNNELEENKYNSEEDGAMLVNLTDREDKIEQYKIANALFNKTLESNLDAWKANSIKNYVITKDDEWMDDDEWGEIPKEDKNT